jgi:hypothetical protein
LIRQRLTVLGWAFGLSALAPAAHALSFSYTDVSQGGSMSAQQLAAFQTAGDYWSSQLSDPVTVYLDIGFDNLGARILGSTTPAYQVSSYGSVRNQLASDARSALDATAVASLQPGPALAFQATQGDLTSRFDNDGSANNTNLALTTANAKALGYATATNSADPDATIVFANAYAGSFSYTRAGGTPANQIDFITVAEHEIGHALGFVSGVDAVDYCGGPANRCPDLANTANEFENLAVYNPLDLFRYSAPGVLDLRVGGNPYFSVDGGATSIESFATGAYNGNGYQASHFQPGALNLMRPIVSAGQSYDATTSDLAALDAIGWDLATAVPEPAPAALLLAGLGATFCLAQRRSRRAPAPRA